MRKELQSFLQELSNFLLLGGLIVLRGRMQPDGEKGHVGRTAVILHEIELSNF